jgi:FkbM family methyltransferase
MYNKIKNKLFGKNKIVKSTLIKEGDFYIKAYNDIIIYSHNVECIERTFKSIFEKNIYFFKSESDSPLIIDAGANIGMGVLYWKRLYPKSKIIAFEPSRMAYKSLLKNVEANNLTNVQCINKAVADKEGVLQFTTNEIISGSLVTEKNLKDNYEVDVTTLGKYIQENIDLLKIDIEGAEKFIFDDIKSNISFLNNIFLEYHSFINEKQYLSKYLTIFEENGFRYSIENENKQNNYFSNKKISLNQDMQLNIWATKENNI